MKKECLSLDVAIAETLGKYIEHNFTQEIRDAIEKDLKKLFKKYPQYNYKGYKTELGMIEDLIILYEDVK